VPLPLDHVEERARAARVTARLYGGGSEHRLRQELLLGIGGVRAVRAFCAITGHAEPEVFHTNEGHAGFLGLERIREYTVAGLTFDEALELCRAGTVFTTHTPVPAGIDRFPRELIERYFAQDAAGETPPLDRVLTLGAETYPGGDPHVFNMAVMGMRLAQRVNGVSRLHGQVSREMFAGLWPGFDTSEVPIGSITNGVHAPTWEASKVSELGDAAAAADAARLWEIRRQLRATMVTETRRRLRDSWRQRGASGAELTWIDDVLDEDVLTIGFARRVPSYKRLTLMLNDPQRLSGLLLDPDRPLQIVIAGKAHPADEGGKRLIQQMVRFADSEVVRRRIVFLPDYDMALARYLVQGCDVWLNNPLRPLEACGTSGMKVALNGGLNVSVRDGWWDEWYDGGNGWEIPTADGVTDPARRDELEASALYELLGKSVAPLFYDTDHDGIPGGWIEMVRHNFRSLGPLVQADRMVREYVTTLYAPAAESSRALAADSFHAGRDLAAWTQRVREAWPSVRIEHVEADGAEPSLGAVLDVRVTAAPGPPSPSDVSLEVVYGARRQRRDHRSLLRHPAGGRTCAGTARPLLRRGRTGPPGPVRLYRPGAPQSRAARQTRRTGPGHLPGRPARQQQREPPVGRLPERNWRWLAARPAGQDAAATRRQRSACTDRASDDLGRRGFRASRLGDPRKPASPWPRPATQVWRGEQTLTDPDVATHGRSRSTSSAPSGTTPC
jgi:starch phosphorylase